MITRNVIFTSRSCSAIGIPSFSISFIKAPFGFISLSEKSNGKLLFRMIISEITTLIACANTVAIAAPAAPMCNTATVKRSPPMFSTQAIATVISGIFESPIPLKMLPTRLYATINTAPAEQITI